MIRVFDRKLMEVMNKKEKPEISVIIPVYRVDVKLLKRCLNSLETQTEQNIEILLVFDEELSEYCELIDSYSRQMGNLRVMEREHQGVSAARNKGIQSASGTWITFVDADDWLESDALEYLKKTAEEQNADIVMGEHLMEYGTASQSHQYRQLEEVFIGEKKRIFETDVLKPQTGAGFVWGKIFRKRFLVENQIYFDEALSSAEDAEFMFRAACTANKIIYITKTCYHYWYNANSAVRRYQSDYVERYSRAMRALKKDIDERKGKEYCREAYYSCVLYHLLLIAVNYSFHPDSGLNEKEQINEFRSLLKQPLFKEAIGHIHYQDFSKTRQITLACIKKRFYIGVKWIAQVRHMQFKKYSET